MQFGAQLMIVRAMPTRPSGMAEAPPNEVSPRRSLGTSPVQPERMQVASETTRLTRGMSDLWRGSRQPGHLEATTGDVVVVQVTLTLTDVDVDVDLDGDGDVDIGGPR